MDPDIAQVLSRRVVTQRLVGTRLPSASAVVTLLTAVQAQEWAHALWSLGMRSTAGTDDSVVEAFDAGDVLRTHVLRPTWHLVDPADLGWLLAATSERVHGRNAGTYRRTGIDARTVGRTAELLVSMLADHTFLTRSEIGERFGVAGIESPTGMRLAHLVMHAELDGLIVSGPLRGAQHTYGLVGERLVGRTIRTPADPTAELWRRFVAGHGPTTVRDFARWSSWTVTTCRDAAARSAETLEHTEVQGEQLWWDPSVPARPDDLDEAATAVRLVPLYDELTLSYPTLGFPQADRHPHPPDGDTRWGSVVAGLTDVGIWRRTVVDGRQRSVRLAVRLAPGTSRAQRSAVDVELDRLATFVRADPVPEEWGHP